MASTKLATKDNAISLEGASKLVTEVKDGLKLVSQGYLAITPHVTKLYDCKGFKALGYKNFDEMCAMEFGMSHGTTVGIRKVFAKFGTVSKENKYSIPDKYLEYGYTKLLFMTDKKFEEAGINPLEIFTPNMTIAEMRDTLTSALDDKADKQDNEAIDTTATEVTEGAEVAEGAEVSEGTEDARPRTVNDVFEDLFYSLSTLRVNIGDSIKKEKLALFDAIESNLKELQKEAKKIK